ncbi:MAG: hypothetical protein ACR2HN_14265, partial [Tepidiformaceae bacterium]
MPNFMAHLEGSVWGAIYHRRSAPVPQPLQGVAVAPGPTVTETMGVRVAVGEAAGRVAVGAVVGGTVG